MHQVTALWPTIMYLDHLLILVLMGNQNSALGRYAGQWRLASGKIVVAASESAPHSPQLLLHLTHLLSHFLSNSQNWCESRLLKRCLTMLSVGVSAAHVLKMLTGCLQHYELLQTAAQPRLLVTLSHTGTVAYPSPHLHPGCHVYSDLVSLQADQAEQLMTQQDVLTEMLRQVSY